ncbi:hypothetical protein [Gordonia hongkongensis]|nr:hypothetical protein [Gordonia hongkongensis]
MIREVGEGQRIERPANDFPQRLLGIRRWQLDVLGVTAISEN